MSDHQRRAGPVDEVGARGWTAEHDTQDVFMVGSDRVVDDAAKEPCVAKGESHESLTSRVPGDVDKRLLTRAADVVVEKEEDLDAFGNGSSDDGQSQVGILGACVGDQQENRSGRGGLQCQIKTSQSQLWTVFTAPNWQGVKGGAELDVVRCCRQGTGGGVVEGDE